MPKLETVRGLAREGYFGALTPRNLARLAFLDARAHARSRRYRILSEAELLATRTSDTAFVFGSGRSLLDVSPDEWEAIGACNTISLREFPRQRWVRADYHVTSEVDFPDEYARRIRENPLYADTVFVVQEGLRAERGNELIARGLLPHGARVFRFRRTPPWRSGPPSRTIGDGLVHGPSSIFDATNLAYVLGFRRIVLAGVDLYDRGYFWLGEGEQRGYEKPAAREAAGFIGADAIVALMASWRDVLERDGVELAVSNPRSLLAAHLPVFSF